MPAKISFISGVYFLGFSKDSVSVSPPQGMLCSCWHRCRKIQGPDLSSA